jgi:hypothetical protein
LPYIGDYIRILAVGSSFYGVFCGNNTPNMANFPNGVTYQRNADWTTHRLLSTDGVTVVAPSIDPFFFHWSATIIPRGPITRGPISRGPILPAPPQPPEPIISPIGPAKPGGTPAKPGAKPTKPGGKPAKPAGKPVKPSGTPTKPAGKSTKAGVKPKDLDL